MRPTALESLPLIVIAIAVTVAVAVVVVAWLPQQLADTQGLRPSARSAEIGRMRTALLAVLGGTIAGLGVFYTHRTFELNRRGHITERFTRAVEQLGDTRIAIRLGGIAALERIARESAIDHPAIMEILTGYLRDAAAWPNHRRVSVGNSTARSPVWTRTRVPVDVQAVVTVLARRETSLDARPLDLSCVDLRSVDFGGASLVGADLSGSNLMAAALGSVDLTQACLTDANLSGAGLNEAIITDADLTGCKLTRTDLTRIRLLPSRIAEGPGSYGPPGATRIAQAWINETHHGQVRLRRSDCSGANLSHLDLSGMDLSEVNFADATLTGTDLTGASVAGANLVNVDLSEAILDRVDLTAAADLSGATLPPPDPAAASGPL